MILQKISGVLCIFSRVQSLHGLSNRPACRFLATKTYDPLRILFCGSDGFSIASLKALHEEHLKSPDRIASIDVICRPGKRVGRGLKKIREVPIKSTALDLSLPIHEIDTFKGWTPPVLPEGPINLIIAVSFGLFVPPRILNGAKYGGLNVHPSLLPDFRGPAPLHHTLLAGRTRTGVTLQTLHDKHFDHGTILKQTPPPGFEIPNPESCTVSELLDLVSAKGARMLIDGIKSGVFVPPLEHAGWYRAEGEQDLIHAAKITTEDRHVDWENWTWAKINKRSRVLGPLWSTATTVPDVPGGETRSFQQKRVILASMERVELPQGYDPSSLTPGLPFVEGTSPFEKRQDGKGLYVFTRDGSLIRIKEMKVEGERVADGFRAALKARMVSDQTFYLGSSDYTFFYDRLR